MRRRQGGDDDTPQQHTTATAAARLTTGRANTRNRPSRAREGTSSRPCMRRCMRPSRYRQAVTSAKSVAYAAPAIPAPHPRTRYSVPTALMAKASPTDRSGPPVSLFARHDARATLAHSTAGWPHARMDAYLSAAGTHSAEARLGGRERERTPSKAVSAGARRSRRRRTHPANRCSSALPLVSDKVVSMAPLVTANSSAVDSTRRTSSASASARALATRLVVAVAMKKNR